MNQPGTIGIIGGGQLGMMLTEAATRLNYKVIVIDPVPNCPAKQVGAKQIQASLTDKNALTELADKCDVITLEIEHVDTDALAELQTKGVNIQPAPMTVAMIQDKLKQKQFLAENNIPTADFMEITDEVEAINAFNKFNKKMLIKTRFGAYDGRGNTVVSSTEEVKQALEFFNGQRLYAEELIPFNKELAVMIARSANGNSATFPLVETIQKRNICIEVIAPAQVSPDIMEKANSLAEATSQHLEGAGVFGIELFLTVKDEILVNEIAPRVHNSGHYTIEACDTSQFEQHIRAITGMELGSTKMIAPAAVMLNILGTRDAPTNTSGIEEAARISNLFVHLYGKTPTKIDRKMGHLTVTADTVEEADNKAWKGLKLIDI